jgi:hypothetical protein
MHKILDNFFDNNSFFLSMIEKDKIRLLKANVSYEKNNFHLLIQRQFIVNALFINNIIRKF